MTDPVVPEPGEDIDRVRAIRRKVVDREMPPWDADRAVGAWAEDGSRSDEAIATIAARADGGAPRGDRAAQPPLPACADSEWTIGEPGTIFAIPPFAVPPEGTVDCTCMRMLGRLRI